MEVYTTRLKELEWEREQLILDREKEKIVKPEKREKTCEEQRDYIPDKKTEKDVFEGTRKGNGPDVKDKLVKEKKPKIIENGKSKLPEKRRDKVRSTSSSVNKHSNSSLDTLCIY